VRFDTREQDLEQGMTALPAMRQLLSEKDRPATSLEVGRPALHPLEGTSRMRIAARFAGLDI
jgi:hypothetical protein